MEWNALLFYCYYEWIALEKNLASSHFWRPNSWRNNMSFELRFIAQAYSDALYDTV